MHSLQSPDRAKTGGPSEPSVRFSTVVIAFSAISAIYADAQPPAPTNLHIFKPGSCRHDGSCQSIGIGFEWGRANQSGADDSEGRDARDAGKRAGRDALVSIPPVSTGRR